MAAMDNTHRRTLMKLLFVPLGIALTILCWGAYGSVLHKGQEGLGGDKLKPLICVGAAYFIVAIIVPVVILASSGRLGGDWSAKGITWSLIAGAAGACGALGIIMALTAGGKFAPIYVMPLVFGGAPIINVFAQMYFQKIPFSKISPIFIAGMIMVIAGATVVLVFKPKPEKPHAAAPAVQPSADQDSQAGSDRPENLGKNTGDTDSETT